jgi:hypothetical protein
VGVGIAEAVGMGLDGAAVDLPVDGDDLERIEILGTIC